MSRHSVVIANDLKRLEEELRSSIWDEYKTLVRHMRERDKSLDILDTVRRVALQNAATCTSNWSGGHTTTNLVEQARREIAVQVLHSPERVMG